jgi:hypothetical protein
MTKLLIVTFTVMSFFLSGSAEPIIRMLFNNGVPLPSNQTCNVWDNLKINQAFDGAIKRRNLRADGVADQGERNLWPAYCQRNCAGYVKNTCRATGCKGYRRGLGVSSGQDSGDTIDCSDQIKDINSKLDSLIAKREVSSSCRTLLMAPRSVSCYNDVVHGEIEAVSVWDLRNITVFDGTSGKSICRSPVYFVQVKVNTCVDTVLTVLTDPKGAIITSNSSVAAPYLGVIDGALLKLTGMYTVVATPDGFVDKKKTMSFEVKEC